MPEDEQPTERDTHFAGFAKLLWDELLKANETADMAGYIDANESTDPTDPTNYLQIIAQRAYDLAYHFIESGYARRGTFRGEVHQSVKMLPDLTEWPKANEE